MDIDSDFQKMNITSQQQVGASSVPMDSEGDDSSAIKVIIL